MNLTPRDQKALAILAAATAIGALLEFVVLPDKSAPAAEAVSLSSAQLRQRLALLRQTAAALPVREALLKQSNADVADRERGIIPGDTAAQAQSELLQTATRVGKASQLDVRSSDFGAPKAFGDYGIVYATVTFDCHPEQLLNFLADLTREQELIVPSEERITSTNQKEKTMGVRMVLVQRGGEKTDSRKEKRGGILMKVKLIALNLGPGSESRADRVAGPRQMG